MIRSTTIATAALVAVLVLPSHVFAKDVDAGELAKARLTNQIAETEWNLRFSSVSTQMDKVVQDEALALLASARQEIDAGNLRTAEGIINRAARPLHEMEPGALAGKHPDQQRWLAERRETLQSITQSGERIAADKGVTADFVQIAERAFARSEVLESEGKPEQALAEIDQAYSAVQKQVAALRSGQEFYLAISERPADSEWFDGLRRYEERRQMTELLITEASAEGIDPAPLLVGLEQAELIRLEATRMAEGQRWDKALQSLEVAYVKFEDSWRQVGLDW